MPRVTNPFPGMNPWLEQFWGDFHASLISSLRDAIQQQLPEPLRARLEERVFIQRAEDFRRRDIYPDVSVIEHRYPAAGGAATLTAESVGLAEPHVFSLSDAEITEAFIKIIHARTGAPVVTMIEVLSLSNKRGGNGRELYLEKQEQCRRGGVSLVEIDLLRGGKPTTLVHERLIEEEIDDPYHISVWRAQRRHSIESYPVPLRAPLPKFRIPLRKEDADIAVDLQALVNLCCERGRYDDLDYSAPLDPPLSKKEATWAAALLREQGLLPAAG